MAIYETEVQNSQAAAEPQQAPEKEKEVDLGKTKISGAFGFGRGIVSIEGQDRGNSVDFSPDSTVMNALDPGSWIQFSNGEKIENKGVVIDNGVYRRAIDFNFQTENNVFRLFGRGHAGFVETGTADESGYEDLALSGGVIIAPSDATRISLEGGFRHLGTVRDKADGSETSVAYKEINLGVDQAWDVSGLGSGLDVMITRARVTTDVGESGHILGEAMAEFPISLGPNFSVTPSIGASAIFNKGELAEDEGFGKGNLGVRLEYSPILEGRDRGQQQRPFSFGVDIDYDMINIGGAGNDDLLSNDFSIMLSARWLF